MSGLEKFESNDSWRSKLKNFLLAERMPDAPIDKVEYTNRYSLDIDEDLVKQHSSTEKQTALDGSKAKTMESSDEKHAYGEEEENEKDDSFAILERMCNKTASDPDSTLFHYLHGDNKIPKSTDSSNTAKDVKALQMSLLENVEAPSAFWDNTITDETTAFQTSPVKMVGLLRPSTIIEECGNESGETLFHSQNTTSQQTLSTAASSMTYQTANDYTSTTASNMILNGTPPEESHEVNLNNTIIDVDAEDSEEIVEVMCSEMKQEVKPSDKTKSPDGANNLDDCIILDDTLNEVDYMIENVIEKQKIVIHPNYSMISDTSMSELDLIESIVNTCDGDPTKTADDALGQDASLGFNDTMEEVEYMMRKGLEFLAQNNLHKDVVNNVQTDKLFSPMPLKDTTHSVVNTPRSKSKETPLRKDFAVNIKPIPKLDLFKKPSGIPTYMREKQPHAKPFSHVVSPVGAYMKRTPVTPLITTLKSNTASSNEQRSTAFRNLCLESSAYQPNFALSSPKENAENVEKAMKKRALPKKAYVSSEFKHIVDERQKITIPGGNKLRKYIEPAMLPSVVRHEGKVKVSSHDAQQNFKSPRKPHTAPDASLADLSVMSGDVSIYTIMDAQKFK